MASLLGFGQPFGGVMQTAFVVQDIRASIKHFQRDCGAGPFFLLDHFLGPDQLYRGAPSTADVTIAMSFAGHMQIELIQPLDEHPSVYRETVKQRGYGFHTLALRVPTWTPTCPVIWRGAMNWRFVRQFQPGAASPILGAAMQPRRDFLS